MDAMGHVNNASYFTYCESARMRYFDVLDLERHREAESHGPVVVSATCNFRRQVHHPAHLEVGARSTKIGTSSFVLEYGLFREGTDELVADGSSVVVWMDYAAGRSVPLPKALKERIRQVESPTRSNGASPSETGP
jgi:acyl-CoA thioester hydrolase